jgi:hypothetical protein
MGRNLEGCFSTFDKFSPPVGMYGRVDCGEFAKISI